MKTFTITSGFVNLTDPCYQVDAWCGKYNVPAKNGTWYATVEHESGMIKSFTAFSSKS